MRKAFAVAVAALAVVASPQTPKAAADAPCGLADAKPLWLDFTDGTVPFGKEIFGKPGIVIATPGDGLPPQYRQLGAGTVYWEMKLGTIVGTTTAPAPADAIPGRAQAMFDRASARSGCSTPLIALNELNGAGTTTPWSTTNAAYRANVLTLLRELAARGARPFLLVNSAPYTDGEAGDWWRQVAQVADIVSEVYFVGPRIAPLGPILGSRRLRAGYRTAILAFTRIGVPVTRLGLMLGFQSGPGTGGREGLQPTSAWLELVKLQTLAAKQVAGDLKIATVWSWGWGTYTQAGTDPDKRAAACVYLWARDQSLCDGPSLAGEGFDASLAEGQLSLASGVYCTVDGSTIRTVDIARIAAVTGDSELAFTALYERLVENEKRQVDPAAVLAAEQSLIDLRFDGSRSAYVAALTKSRSNVLMARAIIGDQLRRAAIQRTLSVAAPDDQQARSFYDAYGDTLARLVKASPPPDWLGGASRGLALSAVAPASLFTVPAGQATSILSPSGIYSVEPLDAAMPLSAVSFGIAAPAIRAALVAFARADAFESWTVRREIAALDGAVCRGDHLPQAGEVDLTAFLPFLALDP